MSVSVAAPAALLPTLAWLDAPLPQGRARSPRYADFQPLGAGGKAEVFRCRDQSLGREVAYKVLHHRLAADQTEVADFLREARILAGLNHPGIPTVFDLGHDCHKRPFFTQTLYEGPTLRDAIDQMQPSGPTAADWPADRIVRIVLAAADAVAHAHRQGVLHCDLKPENIVVGDDDRGQVIDWGIAWVPADMRLKQSHALPGAPPPRPPRRRGSPLYMAPEQAMHQPLDERTDVFGLGATLYECLTLAPPAAGPDVAAVLKQIPTAMPAPVRQLAPQRGITVELEALVMRALARHPSARFSSTADLIAALQECFLDLLINAERPGTPPAAEPAPALDADWWELRATD